MMRDHEGDKRVFFWYARSIYARHDACPKIGFGLYAPEGGTSGEMLVEWHQLRSDCFDAPRLQAFDDSWSALHTFSDLLRMMAEADTGDGFVSQEQFVEMLLACGFEDQTRYADE